MEHHAVARLLAAAARFHEADGNDRNARARYHLQGHAAVL
jgi:hypothetical protein